MRDGGAAFVLVHGAGGSEWMWHKVAPLLAAAHPANRVYAPTLTGYGARAHLATPDLGLETHVQDVLGVLEYEDLRRVVLVGWSYAGMVVSAVAERAPERLAHVVHFDASVPRDGESQADRQSAEYRARLERLRAEGTWLRPKPTEAEFAPYVERGEMSDDDVRVVISRMRPVPVKTLTDPVRLGNPAAAAIPRTYIWCRQNPSGGALVTQLRATPGWRCHELNAGHFGLLTHPRELADLLLSSSP
jgi:pimeloyl-ACP methyl ester carboxylesterase